MKKYFYELFICMMLLLPLAWQNQALAQGGAAEFTSEAGKVAQTRQVVSMNEAIKESSSYRDAAMKVAADSKGKPYLAKNGDYIFIGNNRIAAVFRVSNNELVALVDIFNGGNILAYGNGPVWMMTLADSVKKPAGFSGGEGTTGLIETVSLQAGETSYTLTNNQQDAVLTLRWNKLSFAGEKNVLSVVATVSADAGSPYLRWNIAVVNNSTKRGVWQVDFPRLESIVPMGEQAETGLFLPWNQGRVIDNPFMLDEKFTGQYPGPSAPMQFSAIYGPAGGLFLATHDGKMFMKQFGYECSKAKTVVTYYMRNLPDNRGDAGTGYKMPYDFVMTSFKGNWFDAARLYREWAIKQVWCSGGPLATRKDVPEWYKKLTFWTLQWEQKRNPSWKEIANIIGDKDQTVEDIKQIASTLKVPYATHLYGWTKYNFDERNPDYFPPFLGDEGFRKQVKQMHAAGARVIPYTCVPLWDKCLDSYEKQNVVKHCIKDAVGNSYAWRIDHTYSYEKGCSDRPLYWSDWPCPYTKFWQDNVAEISRKLVADYGVDGIYYDVLSGNAHMCFDPTHGHTTGGGNYWAMGNREALRMARDAIHKANPDAIMTSEGASEVYLDVLDGVLLFGSPKAMPGSVPAFQTVYHDYFLLFGNVIDMQGAIDHLPVFVGESFVHGDQLGWFNVWPMFTPNHPRKELAAYWKDEANRKKNVDFMVHIARLKSNSGYKFLTLGEMEKPLELQKEVPVLNIAQEARLGLRKMPVVLNSVFKAPDGTLGLVFCNGSESQQKATYTIDVTAYGLPAARRYVVKELLEDGKSRVVGEYNESKFSRTETIPARHGMILEIQPEK